MEPPLKLQALVAGKRLFVTSGEGGPCTVAELRATLRAYPTREMLRAIGQAAVQVERNPPNIIGLLDGDVPVPLAALPYLALLSIEESNDVEDPRWGYSGLVCDKLGRVVPARMIPAQGVDGAALGQAIRMFHNLRDPISTSTGSDGKAFEFMVRTSQAQFAIQGALNQLLPRTVLLYRDIWPCVEKAKGVSPLDDLKEITGGLELGQILLFAKAWWASADQGYFRPYSSGQLDEANRKETFNADAQRKLLAWLSASYAEIRADARKHAPPDERYDHYRFNPLIEHPIIRPDIQPDPGNGPIYMLPCPRLLYFRVTSGLYHDLLNLHMGKGVQNPFKEAFGHVFQEYVGVLLREALGNDSVYAEWQYGSAKQARDTPDWIVLAGNRAVVIEVKQSGHFLPSKMWGRLDDLRTELKRTAGRAAAQLNAFQQAMEASTVGLERLRHVESFERVLVTYDFLSWGNWIIREEAQRVAGVGSEFHFHIAHIDEFERLLGACADRPLFDLLHQKRTGDGDQDIMDFREWTHDYIGEDVSNPFLDAKVREMMSEWGVPLPE